MTIQELKFYLRGMHGEYLNQPALAKEDIQGLANLSLGSDSIYARKAIISASRIPSKESLAISEASSRNSRNVLRATSVVSLLGYPGYNFSHIILNLLNDSDTSVRYNALKTVLMAKPPGIEEKVMQLAQSESNNSVNKLANDAVKVLPLKITELWGASIQEGGEASIYGEFSHNGSPNPYRVVFQWGDGSEDTSIDISGGDRSFSAKHVYTDEGVGEFIVNVTIKTKDGSHEYTKETLVFVENVPPKVVIGKYSPTVNEGEIITLSITIKDPGTLDIHKARIDWGDGSPALWEDVEREFSRSHIYVDNGHYNINVTVYDNDGAEYSTNTGITVINVPPEVQITHLTPGLFEGGIARILVEFSDPGILDTHKAQINWGDGNIDELDQVTTPFTAQHLYLEDRDYEVGVTVTDKDHDSGKQEITIPVENLAPVVVVGSDVTIYSGQIYDLKGAFHDPGVRDTHTSHIDWGDGKSEQGILDEKDGKGTISGNHRFSVPGNYEIKLTVTDDEGAETTNSLTLAIIRQPIMIDIKPGEDENKINPKSKGKVKVKLLSNLAGESKLPLSFDSEYALVDSLRFGTKNTLVNRGGSRVTGNGKNKGKKKSSKKDPEYHFGIEGSGIDNLTTSVSVWGQTKDDVYFEGMDAVSIVPGGLKGRQK